MVRRRAAVALQGSVSVTALTRSGLCNTGLLRYTPYGASRTSHRDSNNLTVIDDDELNDDCDELHLEENFPQLSQK